MSIYDTTIQMTVRPDTKTISFNTKLAIYEKRNLQIAIEGYEFPNNTYKFIGTFGPQTVFLSALSVSTGMLIGELNLNTVPLEKVFKTLNCQRVKVDYSLWDSEDSILYARGKMDIWNAEPPSESSEPTPVSGTILTGQADIAAGANYVDVSLIGQGFTTSASVVGTVLIPSGGDQVFVVGVELTSSGGYITSARFNLSSAVSGSNYKLNWMVAQ